MDFLLIDNDLILTDLSLLEVKTEFWKLSNDEEFLFKLVLVWSSLLSSLIASEYSCKAFIDSWEIRLVRGWSDNKVSSAFTPVLRCV